MPKIAPISGYPEWLPAQKRVEQKIVAAIARQLELSGFVPLETRSVEPLSVLCSKGDDKEIYVLKRLHAIEGEVEKLGLHFDLTVPFARYVEQFQSELVFPFKRYQIQKVWRGERKQEGRYREFLQCDLDIVAQNQLPLHFDAEMARLLMQIWACVPLRDQTMRLKLSHRKILQGFYQGLGIATDNVAETLRCVDKLAKIGADEVKRLLMAEVGMTQTQAEKALALGSISSESQVFVASVKALGVAHPLLDEGLDELAAVMSMVEAVPGCELVVDLSIARGLDYYTGTVYEGYLVGHEHIGAVCSGGRYDRLVGGDKKALPGVGVSLGLTRLLGYGFDHGLLDLELPPMVHVLVIMTDEEMRAQANQVASVLRQRGIGADVFHQVQNFGKQIRHAEKRGIPYVWFVDQGVPGEGLSGEVKELLSGQQAPAHAKTWSPEGEAFCTE